MVAIIINTIYISINIVSIDPKKVYTNMVYIAEGMVKNIVLNF
jgi:hypothetical protein